MKQLLLDIKACTICAAHLPHGCRPVVAASPKSKVIIIGQAPGSKVHKTGIPWDDPSGKRLRQWLGVTDVQFYNPDLIALMPMGFCYPGKGKSGDLPPRPECAPQWHQQLLAQMPELQLTILIGQYAQDYYLGNKKKATLTETVQAYQEYWPSIIPLPHPSPRNVAFFKKNPWFEADVVPMLQQRMTLFYH